MNSITACVSTGIGVWDFVSFYFILLLFVCVCGGGGGTYTHFCRVLSESPPAPEGLRSAGGGGGFVTSHEGSILLVRYGYKGAYSWKKTLK